MVITRRITRREYTWIGSRLEFIACAFLPYFVAFNFVCPCRSEGFDPRVQIRRPMTCGDTLSWTPNVCFWRMLHFDSNIFVSSKCYRWLNVTKGFVICLPNPSSTTFCHTTPQNLKKRSGKDRDNVKTYGACPDGIKNNCWNFNCKTGGIGSSVTNVLQ